MKKTLVFLALFFALNVHAYVNTVNCELNSSNGDFTIEVRANEPWVVWRTFDFIHWAQVSRVQGAGHRYFVDPGIGQWSTEAFYIALPRGRKPNNGNHYGWSQPRNPHSIEQ